MPTGHTYEKWKELGYQVKKGAKHSFNHFGNKCFTREQVVKIETKKKNSPQYINHCWKCKNTVDSSDERKCGSCGWLVCSRCKACGCGYGN